MFTGIVTDIGKIIGTEKRGDLRVVIQCSYDLHTVDIGASICCSGVCLTVVDKGDDWFSVDVSDETISCTAEGLFTEGRQLNLERSLKVGDELGGHIVTGHVDGVGTVMSSEETGDSSTVLIELPPELAAYVAPKGSITVDGVSLTVNNVEDKTDGTSIFSLNIIPHTASVTTLSELEKGRAVNLEIDILARYLSRMEKLREPA